jgi:hypothetical protein
VYSKWIQELLGHLQAFLSLCRYAFKKKKFGCQGLPLGVFMLHPEKTVSLVGLQYLLFKRRFCCLDVFSYPFHQCIWKGNLLSN